MKRIFLAVLALLPLLCPTARAVADSAKGACLMNAVTGEVIFEKNGDERLPMASTTKIMTLLVALDKTTPEESVLVSENAASQEGSSAYIETGSSISMLDLEYGLMLNSGNDAAVAIAEHVSGDTERFAKQMNKLAHKIGVRNTSFANPNGLDAENHYTTAKDLAKITQYAMKNEKFREIVSSRSHTAHFTRADGTAGELEFINHNRLLREMDGCIGVKTGYTKTDGRCLVSAAERDGAQYIVVTLNDGNDWKDHKELMELAFSGCHIVRAVSEGDVIEHLKNGDGKCSLIAATDYNLPLNGDKSRKIDLRPQLPETYDFAINEGEKVGELAIYCDDEYIASVDITADADFIPGDEVKSKRCFKFTLINLIKNLL